MSLVVVGTDTEIGKTVTCAMLVARHAETARLAYWKPIATGGAEDSDVTRLREWIGDRADVLDETYRFDPPVSPHLAARWAGVTIDPERILGDLVAHALVDVRRNLVIEGVGGLLVPLTDRGYLLADLVLEMALPTLLVARSTLGTINHTLLTLAELRRRSIALAGVVLVGPQSRDNRDAIERFGRAEVVAEIPRLERVDRESILETAASLDVEGRLAGYFEA